MAILKCKMCSGELNIEWDHILSHHKLISSKYSSKVLLYIIER